MKKFLIGLAPLLALVVFALAPSAALAHKHSTDPPCRVLASFNKAPEAGKCANPPGVSETEATNLREEEDGPGTTPQSTNFVTSGLLVNTASTIRFGATISGLEDFNESPAGYTFFGVDLLSNPINNKEKCVAATGTVPFADIQKGKPSAVFDVGTAWSFSVFSDSETGAESCKGLGRNGKVIIREATLLFDQLTSKTGPVIASGTFVGNYSQPSAAEGKCPGGGIELENKQPGVTTEPASTAVVVDNGVAGKGVLLCFVSANNYLFPKEAPKWGTSFASAGIKEGVGIWKTKEP